MSVLFLEKMRNERYILIVPKGEECKVFIVTLKKYIQVILAPLIKKLKNNHQQTLVEASIILKNINIVQCKLYIFLLH